MLARANKAETPSFNRGYALNKSLAQYPHLYPDFAWSPCLGNTGLVLRDAAGRGFHGTLTNMVPADDWVLSEGRWTLDYDGTNDSMEIGAFNGGIGAANQGLTVSAWVNGPIPGGVASIMQKASGSARPFQLFAHFASNYVRFQQYDGVTNPHATTSTVAEVMNSTWTMVTGVRDCAAQLMKIYVNGRDATGSSSNVGFTTDFSATTTLSIANGDTTGPIASLIDDCVIWNRALSAREVAQLYSLGRGGWAERRARLSTFAPAAPAYTPFAELQSQSQPTFQKYVPVPY